MSVEVRRATVDDREQWNDLVARSPHGTPFHKLECLDFLAETTDDTCYRFVGYKGEELVGVFPVFVRRRGPVSLVFSPPPDLKITYLGPVMARKNGLKTRRFERQNRQLVQGVLDALEAEFAPSYYHVKPSPNYLDTRPFGWNGFDSEVSHTYVVDLSVDRDDLYASFSSDARRAVRDARDADAGLVPGDEETIRRLIPDLADLHADRDTAFGITSDFVLGLYRHLPDDDIHVYEARVDGEYAGGWVILEAGGRAYYWQAYAERDFGFAVNDYAVWEMMQDAMDRGAESFDFVGANKLTLSKYKAKFAPELVSHAGLERGTRTMRAAAGLYKRLR